MAYLSNVDVFLAIAEESHSAMTASLESGRRPKPDGSGYIVTYDQTYTSFKQACATVAFAAMYFEALMYLLALQHRGKDAALKLDRLLYEKRLEAIGVADPTLLAMAKEFREARKELVHEKAIELGQPIDPPPRYAQAMADQAMKFLKALRAELVAA